MVRLIFAQAVAGRQQEKVSAAARIFVDFRNLCLRELIAVRQTDRRQQFAMEIFSPPGQTRARDGWRNGGSFRRPEDVNRAVAPRKQERIAPRENRPAFFAPVVAETLAAIAEAIDRATGG